MGFRDELLAQLPALVFGTLAGKLGGPQAVGAFQRGQFQRGQYEDAQARQAMLDAERQQATADTLARQAEQDARSQSADTRATEAADLTRRNALLEALGNYEADPSALAQFYNVPEAEATPLMAPIVKAKDKAAAQKFMESLSKNEMYKGYFESEEGLASLDNTTITEWRGRPNIKIGEIRAMADTPQVPPKLAAPTPDRANTIDEQDIADALSVAEERKGAPLTAAERSTVRRKAIADLDALRRDPPRDTSATQDARKIATFNSIASSHERSPLIRAGDRTVILNDAADSIMRTPSDPAAQLRLAYSYIQALDTYQSAVREGELGTVGNLGTRLQSWEVALNRVATSGAFIPPDVARNIARDAKHLVGVIDTARNAKRREFASRARVSGVGDLWDQFVAGAVAPAPTVAPTETPTGDTGWVDVEPGVRVRRRGP